MLSQVSPCLRRGMWLERGTRRGGRQVGSLTFAHVRHVVRGDSEASADDEVMRAALQLEVQPEGLVQVGHDLRRHLTYHGTEPLQGH